MPDSNIDNLRSAIEDLARVYTWEVLIANIPAGDGTLNAESLRVLAETTSLPAKTFGDIVVPYKAAKFHLAGKLDVDGTIEITFKEVRDWKVHRTMFNWSQLILQNVAAVGSIPANYKKEIVMTLQDVTGTNVYQITLDGAYPSTIPAIALNYGAEGNVTFPVTFTYDRWTPKVL